MTHTLKIDGQDFELTTDHAASSHGQPVLVGGEPNAVFGPAETCNLLVEDCSDECAAALTASGFTWTDAR